jgi:nitroreductase
MQLDDAIKKYSDKKPDWRKVIQAMDAARYAPIAGNINTLKFILIEDKEKIKKVADACQQDFVYQAQIIVVLVSEEHQIKKMYPERAEMFLRQQAGAAIQNFLLELTQKKIASCWVGYFDADLIKKALDIPEEAFVEAVFPIGTETKVKTTEKKKAELENMVFFDKYKNKFREAKIKVSMDAI